VLIVPIILFLAVIWFTARSLAGELNALDDLPPEAEQVMVSHGIL